MKADEAIQRLAFIKYLYKLGVEQSGKPDPFCWASVLTFHDTVELFLELASEYLSVQEPLKELKFPAYWDKLTPVLKNKGRGELTQRIAMAKLNEARIAFKHHGTPPSKSTIEYARVSVTNFLEENTPIVFNVELSKISLIDMVQCENSRGSLRKAQELLNSGSLEDALDKVAVAFVQLTDDYEVRKLSEYARSPFFFGGSFSHSNGIKAVGPQFSELRMYVERVSEALANIQEAMKIISFGFDYRKYVRFKVLTPTILRIPGGDYKIQRLQRHQGTLTTEDVEFCVEFVIESAITLKQFDFESETWTKYLKPK